MGYIIGEMKITVQILFQVWKDPSLEVFLLTFKIGLSRLDKQYKTIRGSLKELRRRKFWKENIKGGVLNVEVRKIGNSRKVYGHVLAIAEHDHFDTFRLVGDWKRITKSKKNAVRVERISQNNLKCEVKKFFDKNNFRFAKNTRFYSTFGTLKEN